MVNSADTGPCPEDFSCLYKGRRQCLKSSTVCLAYNRPEYANALLIPCTISVDGLYKQKTRK